MTVSRKNPREKGEKKEERIEMREERRHEQKIKLNEKKNGKIREEREERSTSPAMHTVGSGRPDLKRQKR